MLIGTDSKPLGGLSGKEALQQQYERTDQDLNKFRFGGDEYRQWLFSDQRLGKPMLHQDLVRCVLGCNPGLIAEESYRDPNVVGFYLTVPVKTYIVAFDKGWLPEWSIVLTDAADMPIKEQRGWRTVLLRLLQRRALSLRQIGEIVRNHYGFTPDVWNKNWAINMQGFTS